MKIDSKDHEIRDLFAGSYFHIPRFQRPYSWPRENVQDFWDDVVGVQSDDYFLGSMVVYKDKPQRFGVVDGQQRLTTIIVFLAALRNAMRSTGHEELANVWLTLLNGIGVNTERHGDSTGVVKELIA